MVYNPNHVGELHREIMVTVGSDQIGRERASRRQFLKNACGGLGMLALASLLQDESVAASSRSLRRHLAQCDSDHAGFHFEPRAKRVIWLFMHGGPSHVDLFDPKPALTKYAGQPLPDSFGAVMTRRDVAKNPLLAPLRPFRPRGESGLEISDWLPEISTHADDLCVIRSLHGDSVNHPQSVYQMNTGSILMGKPSFGSWLAYGLGSENQDMPAFVVMPDQGAGIKGGPPAWGSGFLPAQYQGVTMRSGPQPILNLSPSSSMTSREQREVLNLTQRLNQKHHQTRQGDTELDARIQAYELAFRMQTEAPEVCDLGDETAETKALYGIDEKATHEFGTRCLLARRMVERGVRFVQLYSGDTNGWDAHQNVEKNHSHYCQATDKPVAGLLTDLKRRGLLDDTLVIWGGEFGRMPMSEQGTGRDHNPWGYSMWLAGAKLAGGRAYGSTDPIGLRAETDKVHVRDFHATLLHLLGIDHSRLTFLHNGLDQRLTGPSEAYVVREIVDEA